MDFGQDSPSLNLVCDSHRFVKNHRVRLSGRLRRPRVGIRDIGLRESGVPRLRPRQYPSADLIEADLARPLPLRDSVFDAVNCAQTLKHLPDLEPTFGELRRVLKPLGRLVFSVTHPDMDWEGYEMRENPDFVLSSEADIHHHDWSRYERALLAAGFSELQPRDVPVSSVIEDLLTPDSYQRVTGRPQILICSALAQA